jgi:hypothetical protein
MSMVEMQKSKDNQSNSDIISYEDFFWNNPDSLVLEMILEEQASWDTLTEYRCIECDAEISDSTYLPFCSKWCRIGSIRFHDDFRT